jgi:hypothetical protein
MLLRGSRNCDGTPTTVETLPGDQITTRPLETAPLVELATKRITIIAAAAGRSIVPHMARHRRASRLYLLLVASPNYEADGHPSC